jgi:hypothetical protein
LTVSFISAPASVRIVIRELPASIAVTAPMARPAAGACPRSCAAPAIKTSAAKYLTCFITILVRPQTRTYKSDPAGDFVTDKGKEL